MSANAVNESSRSCPKQLQREAYDCLSTFPAKILEFNEIITEYIPKSVKSAKLAERTTVEDLNDRAKSTELDGIIRGLARQLISARSDPLAEWHGSLSGYVTVYKKDNTTVGRLVSVMRPAAVQLIADTTILKRWLQALAILDNRRFPESVNSATRCVETIDCWAYEHFFHLKQIQNNRLKQLRLENKPIDTKNDETVHTDLWLRSIQLRNNYIILYESLHDDVKIFNALAIKGDAEENASRDNSPIVDRS